MYDIITEDMKFQAKLHGAEVGGGDPATDTTPRDVAEEEIKDPLAYFPDDVDYSPFTSAKLGELSALYNNFRKGIGDRELTQEEIAYFWTPDRISAFNSGDLLAKRCSVNGELWKIYLHLDKQGKVSEQLIKRLIREEIMFAKLFPTTQDMAKYKLEGKECTEIPDARTGKTVPQHIEALASTGELHKILKSLYKGSVSLPKELLAYASRSS